MTGPTFENTILKIPASTTHEKKCGRYVQVCMKFLYRCTLSSFKSSARIIGVGKPSSSLKILIYTVL